MRKVSILSVLILIGCATTSYRPFDFNQNPCSKGTPCDSVCIDPVSLQPSVNPIHTGRGQVVHAWFTSGTDDLSITSDAFESTGHEKGHAWGRVKKDARITDPNHPPYKYTIHNLTTKRDNDPDIMVDY